MKKAIFYLIGWLVVAVCSLFIHKILMFPKWYLENIIFARCASFGLIGGLTYCLRGVYLSRCVKGSWDSNWETWHYLRPITSGISGFISLVFLKAGLLVLEADQSPEAISYGYLAIAFIAGYNVDNFMKKIESIAKTLWGIKKSRVSEEDDTESDKG